MSGRRQASLGAIFEIARGGSPRPIQDYLTDDPDGVNWISIADASASSKYIYSTKKRIRQSGIGRSRMVKPGDFLLTNSMSFGRPYILRISGCIHDGWLVLSSRNDDVDQDYFFHLLGSDAIYAKFSRLAAGATVKNLNIDLVASVEVEFPPVAEQRRIAAILDQAETLRFQRRAALAQLDSLTQSIFFDMFGDPVTNSKGWPVMPFGKKVALSLRNGLSPSSTGTVSAKILTLTAITGDAFRPDSWKVGSFQSLPPVQQSVDVNDFLICRGNGNVRLVGKGYFPTRSMADVTFPDTMIAARIASERIERRYLQIVWNSAAVRRQIEALARTTNGTFKVNQAMLDGIQIAMPPLALQQTFATRVEAIEAVKVTQTAALAEFDALFASLQHRAFNGRL